MKSLVKKLLPGHLLEAAWAWKTYDAWHARQVLENRRDQPRRKTQYEQANQGLVENQQVLEPGIRLKIIPEIRSIFELYAYGDMQNVREMDGFIRFARGRKCLLDIGALYGDFALVFCTMNGGSAYAVDPSPEAQEVLARLIEANPELDLRPFAVALGKETTSRVMAREWIHLVAVEGAADQANTIQVHEQTLDDFLCGKTPLPDTVKIDAEGAELDILRGGRTFFSETDARIFLEVHPTYLARRGQSAGELLEELDSLGYRVFRSDGSRMDNARKILGKSEGYLVHRVICAKSERLD